MNIDLYIHCFFLVTIFDAGESDFAGQALAAPFDVLVATDCFADETVLPAFFSTVRAMCRQIGSTAFVAATRRGDFCVDCLGLDASCTNKTVRRLETDYRYTTTFAVQHSLVQDFLVNKCSYTTCPCTVEYSNRL